MKEIKISTEVFAAIWAHRTEGEESEDEILKRILGIGTQAREPRGRKKMRWIDDVYEGISSLGKAATYPEIYAAVRRIRLTEGRSIPKSFEAIVRKEIEYHSSDSHAYLGKEDLFTAPLGLGSGVWQIRQS